MLAPVLSASFTKPLCAVKMRSSRRAAVFVVVVVVVTVVGFSRPLSSSEEAAGAGTPPLLPLLPLPMPKNRGDAGGRGSRSFRSETFAAEEPWKIPAIPSGITPICAKSSEGEKEKERERESEKEGVNNSKEEENVRSLFQKKKKRQH